MRHGGIFISYRREDSIAYAGRIYDRLVAKFGRDQVFMDVDTIEPGEDFIDVLERTVAACDVLIVVIGRNWLNSLDTDGRRRLDNPEDFVRLEVAAALGRHIRVIPALVGGASIPRSVDLPADIASLTRRNGIEIVDTSFHMSVTKLVDALDRVLDSRDDNRMPAAGKTTAERRDAPERYEAAASTAGVLAAVSKPARGIEPPIIPDPTAAVQEVEGKAEPSRAIRARPVHDDMLTLIGIAIVALIGSDIALTASIRPLQATFYTGIHAPIYVLLFWDFGSLTLAAIAWLVYSRAIAFGVHPRVFLCFVIAFNLVSVPASLLFQGIFPATVLPGALLSRGIPVWAARAVLLLAGVLCSWFSLWALGRTLRFIHAAGESVWTRARRSVILPFLVASIAECAVLAPSYGRSGYFALIMPSLIGLGLVILLFRLPQAARPRAESVALPRNVAWFAAGIVSWGLYALLQLFGNR